MKKVATTIKIDPSLYDQFKILGIQNHLTLQGFIERCVHRYVNDPTFRDIVNRTTIVSTMELVPNLFVGLHGTMSLADTASITILH